MYQDIAAETNGSLYSSDGMLSRIPENALKIKVPNLFRKGFAFFPQASYKSINDMRECEHMFVINTDNHDKVIPKKNQTGLSAEQISFDIEKSDIFEKEQIISEFERMFWVIDEMDKTCDVKISNWIKKHFHNQMIFIDPGHVAKSVYVEYVKQILKLLGIYTMKEKEIEEVIYDQPDVLYMPVYGCVRDAMDLKWVDEMNCFIKKGTWGLLGDGLDILEYVKQYTYICVNNHSV